MVRLTNAERDQRNNTLALPTMPQLPRTHPLAFSLNPANPDYFMVGTRHVYYSGKHRFHGLTSKDALVAVCAGLVQPTRKADKFAARPVVELPDAAGRPPTPPTPLSPAQIRCLFGRDFEVLTYVSHLSNTAKD